MDISLDQISMLNLKQKPILEANKNVKLFREIGKTNAEEKY